MFSERRHFRNVDLWGSNEIIIIRSRQVQDLQGRAKGRHVVSLKVATFHALIIVYLAYLIALTTTFASVALKINGILKCTVWKEL